MNTQQQFLNNEMNAEFQAVRSFYSCKENMYCYITFPAGKCLPEQGDHIILLPAGWTSLSQQIAKKIVKTSDIWGQETEKFVQVNIAPEEISWDKMMNKQCMYQFVYVKNTTMVEGMSKCFMITECDSTRKQQLPIVQQAAAAFSTVQVAEDIMSAIKTAAGVAQTPVTGNKLAIKQLIAQLKERLAAEEFNTFMTQQGQQQKLANTIQLVHTIQGGKPEIMTQLQQQLEQLKAQVVAKQQTMQFNTFPVQKLRNTVQQQVTIQQQQAKLMAQTQVVQTLLNTTGQQMTVAQLHKIAQKVIQIQQQQMQITAHLNVQYFAFSKIQGGEQPTQQGHMLVGIKQQLVQIMQSQQQLTQQYPLNVTPVQTGNKQQEQQQIAQAILGQQQVQQMQLTLQKQFFTMVEQFFQGQQQKQTIVTFQQYFAQQHLAALNGVKLQAQVGQQQHLIVFLVQGVEQQIPRPVQFEHWEMQQQMFCQQMELQQQLNTMVQQQQQEFSIQFQGEEQQYQMPTMIAQAAQQMPIAHMQCAIMQIQSQIMTEQMMFTNTQFMPTQVELQMNAQKQQQVQKMQLQLQEQISTVQGGQQQGKGMTGQQAIFQQAVFKIQTLVQQLQQQVGSVQGQVPVQGQQPCQLLKKIAEQQIQLIEKIMTVAPEYQQVAAKATLQAAQQLQQQFTNKTTVELMPQEQQHQMHKVQLQLQQTLNSQVHHLIKDMPMHAPVMTKMQVQIQKDQQQVSLIQQGQQQFFLEQQGQQQFEHLQKIACQQIELVKETVFGELKQQGPMTQGYNQVIQLIQAAGYALNNGSPIAAAGCVIQAAGLCAVFPQQQIGKQMYQAAQATLQAVVAMGPCQGPIETFRFQQQITNLQVQIQQHLNSQMGECMTYATQLSSVQTPEIAMQIQQVQPLFKLQQQITGEMQVLIQQHQQHFQGLVKQQGQQGVMKMTWGQLIKIQCQQKQMQQLQLTLQQHIGQGFYKQAVQCVQNTQTEQYPQVRQTIQQLQQQLQTIAMFQWTPVAQYVQTGLQQQQQIMTAFAVQTAWTPFPLMTVQKEGKQWQQKTVCGQQGKPIGQQQAVQQAAIQVAMAMPVGVQLPQAVVYSCVAAYPQQCQPKPFQGEQQPLFNCHYPLNGQQLTQFQQEEMTKLTKQVVEHVQQITGPVQGQVGFQMVAKMQQLQGQFQQYLNKQFEMMQMGQIETPCMTTKITKVMQLQQQIMQLQMYVYTMCITPNMLFGQEQIEKIQAAVQCQMTILKLQQQMQQQMFQGQQGQFQGEFQGQTQGLFFVQQQQLAQVQYYLAQGQQQLLLNGNGQQMQQLLIQLQQELVHLEQFYGQQIWFIQGQQQLIQFIGQTVQETTPVELQKCFAKLQYRFAVRQQELYQQYPQQLNLQFVQLQQLIAQVQQQLLAHTMPVGQFVHQQFAQIQMRIAEVHQQLLNKTTGNQQYGQEQMQQIQTLITKVYQHLQAMPQFQQIAQQLLVQGQQGQQHYGQQKQFQEIQEQIQAAQQQLFNQTPITGQWTPVTTGQQTPITTGQQTPVTTGKQTATQQFEKIQAQIAQAQQQLTQEMPQQSQQPQWIKIVKANQMTQEPQDINNNFECVESALGSFSLTGECPVIVPVYGQTEMEPAVFDMHISGQFTQ